MFFKFRVILLSLFLSGSLPAQWYVWQRQWSDELIAAAADARAEKLYILRGELELEAEQWQWKRVAVPEAFRSEAAVLRAPAAALRAPEQLLEALISEVEQLESGEIQLDIDVPERQLAEYARLLHQLTRCYPERLWSVTLLPCHLERPECAAIFDSVAFYVLQLHGIEPPERREIPYTLMNTATVDRAIRKAREFGHPFRIALPTYAYVLAFYPDGRFRRLYAEAFPGDCDDDALEIAAPDLPLIAAVIRANPDLPVIWFRLPVAPDRWTLPRETIAILETGTAPEPELELIPEADGRQLRIYCRWLHRIPLRRQPLELRLPEEWRRGECFLLNGAGADNWSCGAPPEVIQVPPAPSGKKIPVAIITR